VNVVAVPAEDAQLSSEQAQVALLTVCKNGFGKRTLISEYRKQGRSGKGVIDIKTHDRNGPVVGSCQVTEGNDVMIITTAGKVIRMPVSGISLIGRNTMGVKVVSLEEGESVGAVAVVIDEGDGDGDEPVDQEDLGTNGSGSS
jgi:DNA gyrase subunit A